MPPGFYTPADVPVLVTHCLTWVLYRNAIAAVVASITADQARDKADKDGFGGMGSKGSQGQTRVHPLMGEVRALAKVILQCADRLGMSPAARTRLEAPEGADPHGEFAGLIGGTPASGARIN
jgi:phage terminase small subunit